MTHFLTASMETTHESDSQPIVVSPRVISRSIAGIAAAAKLNVNTSETSTAETEAAASFLPPQPTRESAPNTATKPSFGLLSSPNEEQAFLSVNNQIPRRSTMANVMEVAKMEQKKRAKGMMEGVTLEDVKEGMDEGTVISPSMESESSTIVGMAQVGSAPAISLMETLEEEVPDVAAQDRDADDEECEAMCTAIVREHLQSERNFCRALRRLCVQFLRPMREYAACRPSSAVSSGGLSANLSAGGGLSAPASSHRPGFISPAGNTSSILSKKISELQISSSSGASHPQSPQASSGTVSTPSGIFAVAAAAVSGATASSVSEEKKSSAFQRPEVAEEDVAIIAGPAEDLLKLHEDLLARMEARESDWEEPTQGVSDIILELLPRFNLHRRYAKNHPRALATLDWLTRRAHGFARFIESKSRESYGAGGRMTPSQNGERANFLAYLALPLDRVLRIAKFLDDLVQWTPLDHPDRDGLVECRDRFDAEILSGVVHELRMSQEQLRVLDVQSNVHSLREPLAASPSRRLAYHGRVTRIDPITRNAELMYLFMFDDMAMWCRESTQSGTGKTIYTYREKQRVRRGAITEIVDGEGLDGAFALQLDGWVHILMPGWGGSLGDKAKRREWCQAIANVLGQEIRTGAKESKKAIQRAKESLVLENVDRIY